MNYSLKSNGSTQRKKWDKKETALVLFGIYVVMNAFLIWMDKIHPKIFIVDYTAICSTIWQVQTSIATLSVLGLSLFTNFFNSFTYYGVKYKDFVRRTVNFFGLSYWDIMFITLLLVPMNLFSVLFNSLSSIGFVFGTDIVCVFYLMYKNIELLSIDENQKTILKSNLLSNYDIEDVYNLNVHTIDLINQNNLDEYKDNIYLYIEILAKDEEIIDLFVKIPLYLSKIGHQQTIYYENLAFLFSVLRTEIEKGSGGENAEKFILECYKVYIQNIEIKAIKLLNKYIGSIENSEKKNQIISVTIIYLYYLCFYDNEYSSYFIGKDKIKKLKSLSFLCDFQIDIKNNRGLLFFESYKYVKKNLDLSWEFLSEFSSGKIVYLPFAIQEFYLFLGILVDPSCYLMDIYNNFDLKDLNSMIGYFNSDGEFDKKENFEGISEFYNWFNPRSDKENQLRLPTKLFYLSLCEVFIKKLIEDFSASSEKFGTEISQGYKIRKTKIENLIKQSPIYRKNIFPENTILKKFEKITNIRLFYPEQRIIPEKDDLGFTKEIEEYIIKCNKNLFTNERIWLVEHEKSDNFNNILSTYRELMDKNVIIDSFLNNLLTPKNLCGYHEDENITREFFHFQDSLKYIGSLQDRNFPIFIDSKKYMGYFFIERIDLLPLEENDIRNELNKPTFFHDKEKYLINIDEKKIVVDESTAREYYQIAYKKIVVSIRYTIGNELCGILLQSSPPKKVN